MKSLTISAIIGWLLFIIGVMAAWITHVVACIEYHAWVLLVIGLICPPIGWIHGIMVWFGAQW